MTYLDSVVEKINEEIRGQRIRRIILIIVIGGVGSFLVLLMIYVALAQFFLVNILDSIPDQYNLTFIILGMFFVSLVSSIIISLIILDTIKRTSIIYSSILSFISTVILILLISFVSLSFLYPNVYNNVVGMEYLFVLPISIVYFSFYVLDSFIYLFVMIVVFYYMFFSVFLYKLYEEK